MLISGEESDPSVELVPSEESVIPPFWGQVAQAG